MKIESVRIENFRSFKDETIFLDDYTCFVGPNGAGKSTIIYALNVFFRQYKDSQTDLSKLIKDDFHHKNIKMYRHQRILAVRIDQYIYAVPYVLDTKKGVIFLKTVYPSRELTKRYLKK